MGRLLVALEETDGETLRFTRSSIHRRALTERRERPTRVGHGHPGGPPRASHGVGRWGGHHGARSTALELERWTSRTAGQSLNTACRVQTTSGSVDWVHGLDPILCVAKPWPWVPTERGRRSAPQSSCRREEARARRLRTVSDAPEMHPKCTRDGTFIQQVKADG